MKFRYSITAFAIAFLLQGSVLNLISIFGVTPNLILCLVTGFAFMYENNYFTVFAAVAMGLLMDICYMPYVGISAMSYFLICLGVMSLRTLLNKERIAVIMLVMAASTIVFQSLVWGISLVMGTAISFILVLKYLPLQILFNVCFIAIFYVAVSGRVIRYRNDRYYI
ncbi:MAG: rod shape-determining protein MreD [Eubacteriales bacterium]|nr:rod shape-determining protein MreD [Eubacteriales bacterium]